MRNSAVRIVTVAAMAVVTCGLLSACAGTQDPGTSAGPVGDPVSGGVLRLGITGGSSTDVFDPTLMTGYAAPIPQVFEPLVAADTEGKPSLIAAESMTPNADASVWTVKLKPDMRFQDGSVADANDLIFSLHHIFDVGVNGVDILRGLEIDRIDKVDDLTVSLPFASPYSSLMEAMISTNNNGVYLLPEEFNAEKPIGSGPFSLTSFEPNRLAVLQRFDGYHGTPAWLDGVEISYFEDAASQANALASGVIDVAGGLPGAISQTVRAQGKQVVVSKTGAALQLTMNTQIAPFDDVRVRQAFRLMIDREQINDVVFNGDGVIANDRFGVSDPLYDHSIPQRAHDVEAAKKLLAEAGYSSGLTVDLRYGAVQVGATDFAQLFVQQAAAAGVTVNLRQVDVGSFYSDDYFAHRIPFMVDYDVASPYLPRAKQFLVGGAAFNSTNFDNAEFTALFNEAQATVDPQRLAEVTSKMQHIEDEQGGYVVPVFYPIYDAFDQKVHGVVPAVTGYPLNGFRLKELWIS